MRERLCGEGSRPVAKLHRAAVEKVCAAAQSGAYRMLEDVLNPEEMEILKRGRNANSARAPKNADVGEYRRATGVEALFGYLYLSGRIERINELFAIIEGRPAL